MIETTREGLAFHGLLGVGFMTDARAAGLYGLGLRADVLGRPQGGYPEPELAVTANVIVGLSWGTEP